MACEASATEGAALSGILEMVCSYFRQTCSCGNIFKPWRLRVASRFGFCVLAVPRDLEWLRLNGALMPAVVAARFGAR